MKLGNWYGARYVFGVDRLDLGIERSHRNRHVRRVYRDALVAGAEDGVDPVEPPERRTARAGIPFVARLRHIVEVVATRPLQQITTGRGFVSQLRACARQQRPTENAVSLPHALVRREVAIPHHRADAKATFRCILNLI